MSGAYSLFSALTESSDEELHLAGQMVKDAFWHADEAERYQGEDVNSEEQEYRRATRLLKEARDTVEMDCEVMEYRGYGWWKNYRRGEKFGLVFNLA